MKPILRNRFVKKLTRERVVPMIIASVSSLIFGTTGSGLPSLPKFANSNSTRASLFSVEFEELVHQISLSSSRSCQKGLGAKRNLQMHARFRQHRQLQSNSFEVRPWHTRTRRLQI